jgi:hypothetical protein
MRLSFDGYLLRFTAAFIAVLLAVWLYVLYFPMAFLPSGYPAWVAKSGMLRDCQLGQIAFFGDSRLEAGVVPTLLPVDAVNFGLAAGTPLEVHSAVQRALSCPTPPKQVVISLVASHFGPMDQFFWGNDLLYGFLSPAELLAAEQLASELGDTRSFTTAQTPEGLSGRVRNWMYMLHFPSLYFSNLVQARLIGRTSANQARLAEVRRSRGFSEYRGGPAGGGRAPAEPGFAPAPLSRTLFERTLEMLQARGIETLLLTMPAATSSTGEVASPYLDYLRSMTNRFAGVHLVTQTVPGWPARMFADGAHLNGAGARSLSTKLAACIVDGQLRPGCDLAWREADVSQTAPARLPRATELTR